ncbi:MAG: ABC transporter permease [Planctomycetes bacterium]|nr:ABC transporter permease [Planctomycetota bacterium]
MSGAPREWIGRRALIAALVRRAVIARYRGTSVGFLWTFLHPAVLFAAYALVFGVYVRVDVERYPAFLIAGLLPWTWFAQSVAIGTTSILGDAPFVRQGAFPPSLSPLVASLAGLVNFALGLPVLLVALALLGVPPGRWLLLAPVVALLQLGLVLGLSLMLAALCVRYRDVIQLVQSVLPVLFLLTPVAYPAELVPARWRWVVDLNPIAHLVQAWQDVLLGRPPEPRHLAVCAVAAAVSCAAGCLVLEALRDRIPEEL